VHHDGQDTGQGLSCGAGGRIGASLGERRRPKAGADDDNEACAMSRRTGPGRRFDAVALVCGLVFSAAAVIVLAGGSLIHDGHVLVPAALVGLGIALFVQTSAPARRRHDDDRDDDADDVWL
jgi:hypothetical protein